MPPIIGRDAELAQIHEFLIDAAERMVAFYLYGPAGIGKSTLLRAALDEAVERGYRVVSTRPSEAEAQLPFAALNDLFGALLDEVEPALPAPQRLALDMALLRVPTPPEAAPEPLAVSLATLQLVRAASGDRPLVVAIDDVQWLDGASASVLEFVVRRLDAEPIALVAAERVSDDGVASRIVRDVAIERRRALHVSPIAARETGRLLASAIGLNLPPSSVSRLHALAGGNPFYAVELGRALQRRGVTRLDGDVSVPSSLAGLVSDRLDHLSSAGSVVVRYASALSQPSIGTLESALGADVAAEGVADAVAGDILERDDAVVRFTHPLLAAEAYGRMDEATRRDVHRRLAEVVTEVEERATHLDASTSGHDEPIASVLDEAAMRANERGAPDAAAEFAERAVRRTAAGDALTRRRIASAGYRMRAGDLAQARAGLETALVDATPGPLRAETLVRLGEVRLLGDDWREAERLLDEALEQADPGIPLRIEAMVRRAGISFATRRHLERGLALITEAFRLADDTADPKLLARVIGPYATWQWDVGHHADLDAMERRAAGLGAAGDHLRVADHFDADFAAIKSWGTDHRGARALWDRLIARAEERGDYSSIPQILHAQTRADFYAGRADDAMARLEEAEAVARLTGHGSALMSTLHERAIVSARIGRPEAAWDAVRAAVAQRTGMGMANFQDLRVREELAALELSRGDYKAALDALGPEVVFDADTDAMDSTLPTRAEALVRLGRLDEAEEVLERFRVQAVGRWFHHASADIDAGASRVGALLAAARGDLEEATRLIDEALKTYATSNDLWSRARALLAAADIHRRSRRRSQARASASEARALFEHFGAALWAERAREVLQRIGAARGHGGVLTPTQAQVAELAVEGLTNRQIGERLFMSVHTVEAHLTAAYRALGIGSRRELASALRGSARNFRDTPLVQDAQT